MATSASSQFQEPLQSISPTDDAHHNVELSASKPRSSNFGDKSDLADDSSRSYSTLETQAFDPDSKEIRRVRWKVDRRLIPLLSVLYLCSFLDRVNIGNAKVANLEEDLKLQPGVYHLACSIFYIGYIMGEVPANLALKKLGPRTWIPIVMVAWGTVSMCMAALTNGAGLLVARFFLGLAESGYAPGPVYIISLWYRRCEHALRVGIFFSAATIAGAFGGLLAYGIALMHGAGGLRAWQWIFIIEGIPTIICSIIAYIFLPDFPETSTFLTPDEKELNIKRLRIDAGPATDNTFSRSQVWAAFKDWKVIAHMWIGMLHAVSFASLGLFVPSITLGFGFDWPSSNIGGHTKKAVAIALVISVAQIGSIVGGQLYREYDAPFYVRSHTICAGLLLANVFNILGLKYLLRRENRRREQLTPEDYEKECRESDATDKHPDFRYFE
ncbi:unnamed protein product [Mortierella alpina]